MLTVKVKLEKHITQNEFITSFCFDVGKGKPLFVNNNFLSCFFTIISFFSSLEYFRFNLWPFLCSDIQKNTMESSRDESRA